LQATFTAMACSLFCFSSTAITVCFFVLVPTFEFRRNRREAEHPVEPKAWGYCAGGRLNRVCVSGGELGRLPELLGLTLAHDDSHNGIAAMMMHHGNQLGLGQGIQGPSFGKAIDTELGENF